MDATSRSGQSRTSLPANTAIRNRPTTVCAPCKRLKTGCDKRTPCGNCRKRNTPLECLYTEGASDRVDLQQVFNRVVSLEHTVTFLAKAVGLSDEEAQNLANDGQHPEDFDLSNVLRVPTNAVKKRITNAVALSSAPYDPSAIPSSANADASNSKRSKDVSRGRLRGATKHKTATVMASNGVFGRASTRVPFQELDMLTDHLNIDITSALTRESSDETPPLAIRTTTSELEQLHHLSVNGAFHTPSASVKALTLAQLFTTPQQPDHSSSSTGTWPSSTSTPTNVPDPQPPDSTISAVTSPRLNPSTIPGIITSVHLQRLPPTASNLYAMLLAEFENVMVVHPCLSLPDMKRRIESTLRPVGEPDGRSSPPTTLAQYAVTVSAFALGAQGYTARVTSDDRSRNNNARSAVPSANPPQAPPRQRTASASGESPRERYPSGLGARNRTTSAANSLAMSLDENQGRSTGDLAGSRARSVVNSGTNEGSAGPPPDMPAPAKAPTPRDSPLPSFPAFPQHAGPYPSSIPFPAFGSNEPPTLASLPSLPKLYEPDELHALALGALMAHDALGLAPSLDYIVAHILCWLLKLHAPSPNSTAKWNREDTIAGGGGATVVDMEVWKGLGKVVNVARGMGLSVDPDEFDPPPDDPPTARRSSKKADRDGSGDENMHQTGSGVRMSLWEKEMRRRVWWDLCYYDVIISDYMGFQPLIDDTHCTTRMPTNVDDSEFGPWSSKLPPPRRPDNTDPTPATPSEGATNLTYFIERCKLITLMKTIQRQAQFDSAAGELSFESANRLEDEIDKFVKQLPEELAVDLRLNASPTTSPRPSARSHVPGATDPLPQLPSSDFSVPPAFPASDVLAAQACELRSLANALILKLWTPHLKGSASSQKLRNNPSLSACTKAAHGIVHASHQLLTRFRSVRPAAYGFYGFGRMVFHAGLVLAKVVMTSSEEIYAEIAYQKLKAALEVMKDPVVAGLGMRQNAPNVALTGASHDTRHAPLPSVGQAIRILEIVKSAAGAALGGFGVALGSKRKHEEQTRDLRDLGMDGFQIPYLGGSVMTGPLPVAADPDGTGGVGVGGLEQATTAEALHRGLMRPPVMSPLPAAEPPAWAAELDGAFQPTFHETSAPREGTGAAQNSDGSDVSSVHNRKPASAYPAIGFRDRKATGKRPPQAASEERVAQSSAAPSRKGRKGSQKSSGSSKRRGKQSDMMSVSSRNTDQRPVAATSQAEHERGHEERSGVIPVPPFLRKRSSTSHIAEAQRSQDRPQSTRPDPPPGTSTHGRSGTSTFNPILRMPPPEMQGICSTQHPETNGYPHMQPQYQIPPQPPQPQHTAPQSHQPPQAYSIGYPPQSFGGPIQEFPSQTRGYRNPSQPHTSSEYFQPRAPPPPSSDPYTHYPSGAEGMNVGSSSTYPSFDTSTETGMYFAHDRESGGGDPGMSGHLGPSPLNGNAVVGMMYPFNTTPGSGSGGTVPQAQPQQNFAVDMTGWRNPSWDSSTTNL